MSAIGKVAAHQRWSLGGVSLYIQMGFDPRHHEVACFSPSMLPSSANAISERQQAVGLYQALILQGVAGCLMTQLLTSDQCHLRRQSACLCNNLLCVWKKSGRVAPDASPQTTCSLYPGSATPNGYIGLLSRARL